MKPLSVGAALESRALQADYFECWQGLKKNFNPG